MKKLIYGAIPFLALVCLLFAADPRGRVDTRKLAGVNNFVQDEFERATKPSPAFYNGGQLYYNSTNSNEGIVFLYSNATVVIQFELPNPTNNPGRKYEVTTMGACTARLTNLVASFTSNNTAAVHVNYFIGSNKTAIAYSTGTNWLVRDF